MFDKVSLISYRFKGNKSEVECSCHSLSFSNLYALRIWHNDPLREIDADYRPVFKRENKTLDDPVNHPSHYTSDPSGVECITVTRHRNFNIGNAIKYLWRAGLKDKDTLVQDLRKAIWYIQNEIEKLEGK